MNADEFQEAFPSARWVPETAFPERRREWQNLASDCYPVWFSGPPKKPERHLEDLQQERWAWEFLRRNPDYEQEFDGILSRAQEYVRLQERTRASVEYTPSVIEKVNLQFGFVYAEAETYLRAGVLAKEEATA